MFWSTSSTPTVLYGPGCRLGSEQIQMGQIGRNFGSVWMRVYSSQPLGQTFHSGTQHILGGDEGGEIYVSTFSQAKSIMGLRGFPLSSFSLHQASWPCCMGGQMFNVIWPQKPGLSFFREQLFPTLTHQQWCSLLLGLDPKFVTTCPEETRIHDFLNQHGGLWDGGTLRGVEKHVQSSKNPLNF